MIFKRVSIIFFLILLSGITVYAQEDKQIYYEGINAAKSGDFISAFMNFQSIVANSAESKYKPDALFATGEYYFDTENYRGANDAFVKLINDYPDSKSKLFALVYLLKIAEIQGNEAVVSNLENAILTFKQQIFLFKNSKEFKYKSPLGKKYKAVYYIEKIEFYLEGELFAQISY